MFNVQSVTATFFGGGILALRKIYAECQCLMTFIGDDLRAHPAPPAVDQDP